MKKAKKNNKKRSTAGKAKKPSLTSAQKTRRTVIIIISVIVGLAITVGAVLGIITAAKNSSYLMKLDNVGITPGVASYLSSYFKALYMQNLAASGADVSDTPSFWNKKVFKENTYGDYLAYETEEYIKELIASNAIFDKHTSLTSEDRDEIDLAIKEILVYRADGQKAQFNQDVKNMDFDYKDFQSATEMLYKSYVVKTSKTFPRSLSTIIQIIGEQS